MRRHRPGAAAWPVALPMPRCQRLVTFRHQPHSLAGEYPLTGKGHGREIRAALHRMPFWLPMNLSLLSNRRPTASLGYAISGSVLTHHAKDTLGAGLAYDIGQ
jgi:hypothetical protein